MQPPDIARLSPSWRSLIAFGGIVLLVVATAISSPAWVVLARGETGPQEDPGGRAAPAAVARPPLSPLVGVWQRRDAWLWVDDGGTARLRWRTDWCEPDTRGPCDQVDGRGLRVGAFADIRLATAPGPDPASLEGQVVATNAPGPLRTGPISLSRVADDLVVLRQGDRSLELCRSPRDLNFCDASEN
jgi:hypothetical protein